MTMEVVFLLNGKNVKSRLGYLKMPITRKIKISLRSDIYGYSYKELLLPFMCLGKSFWTFRNLK